MSQVNQGAKCHQKEDHNNYVPQITMSLFPLLPGNDTVTTYLGSVIDTTPIISDTCLHSNIRNIPILSGCVRPKLVQVPGFVQVYSD